MGVNSSPLAGEDKGEGAPAAIASHAVGVMKQSFCSLILVLPALSLPNGWSVIKPRWTLDVGHWTLAIASQTPRIRVADIGSIT